MQLNFLVIKCFLLLDRTCSLRIGTESNPFIRHVSSEGVVAFGAESHGLALRLRQPVVKLAPVATLFGTQQYKEITGTCHGCHAGD